MGIRSSMSETLAIKAARVCWPSKNILRRRDSAVACSHFSTSWNPRRANTSSDWPINTRDAWGRHWGRRMTL